MTTPHALAAVTPIGAVRSAGADVEVVGELAGDDGRRRFDRRLVVSRDDLNAELAAVDLGEDGRVAVEVRGTVQEDGVLCVHVVLSAGEEAIDAVSTVVGVGRPERFSLDLVDDAGPVATAQGWITNRPVPLSR